MPAGTNPNRRYSSWAPVLDTRTSSVHAVHSRRRPSSASASSRCVAIPSRRAAGSTATLVTCASPTLNHSPAYPTISLAPSRPRRSAVTRCASGRSRSRRPPATTAAGSSPPRWRARRRAGRAGAVCVMTMPLVGRPARRAAAAARSRSRVTLADAHSRSGRPGRPVDLGVGSTQVDRLDLAGVDPLLAQRPACASCTSGAADGCASSPISQWNPSRISSR